MTRATEEGALTFFGAAAVGDPESTEDVKARLRWHAFGATPPYLQNGGLLEHAQHMAAHASPTTTKLYDRRAQEASLDEVERIIL